MWQALPDDIHSIANSSPDTARHLHFYGQAVETLRTRLQFNLEKQTASTMAPVVITRICWDYGNGFLGPWQWRYRWELISKSWLY
jgi:hypothetical protein